mgnify:CR=1 FL=1
MNDNLNITIRIANLPPIPMAIRRDEEEVMRTAEYNVNKLWNSWSMRYKSKTPAEVLAMVTFRFAELYFRQSQAMASAAGELDRFDKELSRLLIDMEDSGSLS